MLPSVNKPTGVFFKTTFLLAFLLVELFGLGFIPQVFAATCTISTAWYDTNNNSLGNVSTSDLGQSYKAVAVYNNCVNLTEPRIYIFTPSGGPNLVGLGGPIQNNPEPRSAVVNFSQVGNYYFKADVRYNKGLGTGYDVYKSPQSTTITVSPAGSVASPSASPIVWTIDKSKANIDDTITIYFKDVPDESRVYIKVNTAAEVYVPPFTTSDRYAFPLKVTTANGFKLNEKNTITARITDSAGTALSLTSASNTINIGTVASADIPSGQLGAGATGESAAPGVNAKGECTDPTKCLYNPLPQGDLLMEFLSIVKLFLGGIGVWAVLFIIVGGYQIIMASGNEEMYLKGRKTVIWAILGVVIAVLSFSVVAIVQNLLGASIK